MQIFAIGIERATVVLAVAGHIQAWSQFHFEARLIKARPFFSEKRTRSTPEVHLIFHAWVRWAVSLFLDGTVYI